MIRIHPNVDQNAAMWHLLSVIKFAQEIGKFDQLMETLRRIGGPMTGFLPFKDLYQDGSDYTEVCNQAEKVYREHEDGSLVFISPDGRFEAGFAFVLYTRIPLFEQWALERENGLREKPLEVLPSWASTTASFEKWLREVKGINDVVVRDDGHFLASSTQTQTYFWDGGYTGRPYMRTYNGGIIYHHRSQEWSIHT